MNYIDSETPSKIIIHCDGSGGSRSPFGGSGTVINYLPYNGELSTIKLGIQIPSPTNSYLNEVGVHS